MSIRKGRNVYHVIAPILAVSKLAAVCNVRRMNSNNAAFKYTKSQFMTVIQAAILIICILHLGFVPYALIYLEQLDPGTETTNSTAFNHLGGDLTSQKFITKMANIVLLSFTAILARLANTVQLPKIFPSLIEDIHDFDKMVFNANNDFAWNFGLSVLLVLISWPYQFYSILIVTTDNWAAFLMFYINLYNNFSCISCEFQFVSLCWLIQSRIRGILEELKEILVKNVMDGRWFHDEQTQTFREIHQTAHGNLR
ncbi:unnamed protein product [Acanthoscelides obtectus]|uniref:Uncharacterized protein n=1 Tax=Acanthoscelides obtectus TaxID=200917 RepID=A0A9P0KB02_ACAOB|nr:unnamed protein product [Acanthoscelides obtectus]CAK1635046.1 hypothetical protein AOBTE_LOCUS9022 [Acanthoscelides obtectus]